MTKALLLSFGFMLYMYYRGLCSRHVDYEKRAWPFMKMRLLIGWTIVIATVWPSFVLLVFVGAPLEWFIMMATVAAAQFFILLGYLTPPRWNVRLW